MTLVEAKAAMVRQLYIENRRGPICLDWLCGRLGVRRTRKRFSKKEYAAHVLYGRALQSLKKEGRVEYRSKAAGGPGWILRSLP